MSIKAERLLIRAKKLTKKGELEKAKEIYSSILKTSPDNKVAKNELVAIKEAQEKTPTRIQLDEVMKLYSSGLIEESLSAVNLIIQKHPNEPILFNISGACYSEIGPIDSAISNFKKAISLKPDYYEAHYNLAVVFQKNKQIDEAFNSYEKAITIKHAYPQAHNNIGMINLNKRELDSAVKSFEWAIAYNPNYVEAHNNLGAVFQELMLYEKAKQQYEKALSINPKFAQALNNLGATCEIFGLKEQAIENYNKAIDQAPNYTEAHRNLSALKKYKKNDSQINLMESLYSRPNLTLSDKRNLSFALAKVNEDLGNDDKFFKFLNAGNNLRKQELNYSFASSNNFHLSLLKAFKSPPKIITQSDKNKSSIRPIFVVGMPRSGTTLVEQIISSHHEVYGAGELNNLKKITTPIFQEYTNSNRKVISEEDILSLRKGYLNSLLELNFQEKIVTDKMPINFRLIGFILSAIPEAKIVHVKRDARATCWSNYKHYFSSGNGFTFDQEDLTKFYKLYSEIMDFWHKLFPNKIYDLNYEKLTENQKKETEKLLKYCELNWDKKCLEFYKNGRGIKTASASQVRQKMYQGSSDAWKKYESYIEPLISGLEGY
ncbi:MAG: tetratricopeptide repeat-containing sulfotransferase family protein [Candidatus Pseudothioglobus sp.]